MAKKMHPTPMLDELESGPWPSFVTGLKRLAKDNDMMVDLMGQLEASYRTKKGYWKGGTVSVFGYGGGIIPRFTELKDESGKPQFPDAAEFHTLRVMPPPGMHYNTDILRKFCDTWERHASGPHRLPRAERRHHVPGRALRQGPGRLRRDQRARLRPGRRRPGRAHLDVLRGRGALRAVVLRRGGRAPHRPQQLHRRHPPPVAALQVQVQVLGLPERLHELDPALGHGRHRHLARQHPHRREARQGVFRQARRDRPRERRGEPLPDQGDPAGRRRRRSRPAPRFPR